MSFVDLRRIGFTEPVLNVLKLEIQNDLNGRFDVLYNHKSSKLTYLFLILSELGEPKETRINAQFLMRLACQVFQEDI